MVEKYFSKKLESFREKIRNQRQNNSLFPLLISLRLFPMTPNWFLNIVSPIVGIPVHLFFLSVFFGKFVHKHFAKKSTIYLPVFRFDALQLCLYTNRIDTIKNKFDGRYFYLANICRFNIRRRSFCIASINIEKNSGHSGTSTIKNQIELIDDMHLDTRTFAPQLNWK